MSAGHDFTLSEVAHAQRLYDEGKEIESLDLVERLLGLGDDVNADIDRLRPNLGSGPTDQSARLIKALLTLRSKCFPAIMDKGGQSCPDLPKRAVHQLAVVEVLYPGDSYLIAVSAQVVFFLGRSVMALEMVMRALEIDPANETAKRTRSIIVDNMKGVKSNEMTQAAILLLQSAMDAADSAKGVDRGILEKAHGLLQESLDADEQQPLGWAGLGWLSLIIGERDRGIHYLKKARLMDTKGEEPFIDSIISSVKQQGIWRD